MGSCSDGFPARTLGHPPGLSHAARHGEQDDHVHTYIVERESELVGFHSASPPRCTHHTCLFQSEVSALPPLAALAEGAAALEASGPLVGLAATTAAAAPAASVRISSPRAHQTPCYEGAALACQRASWRAVTAFPWPGV